MRCADICIVNFWFLLYFGASETNSYICMFVSLWMRKVNCTIDCWKHFVFRSLSYLTVEIFSSGGFHRWKCIHKMVQYQDCPSGGREASVLQRTSQMVRSVLTLNVSVGSSNVWRRKSGNRVIAEWVSVLMKTSETKTKTSFPIMISSIVSFWM